MSKRQEVTAVRVANVPAEDFEAAVEREHPATVTQLAEMGKASRPAPPGFVHATQAIGMVREFAILCREHPAPFIAGAIYPYEAAAVRADLAVITEWVTGLLAHLPEAE
jgi:hypothetical protein